MNRSHRASLAVSTLRAVARFGWAAAAAGVIAWAVSLCSLIHYSDGPPRSIGLVRGSLSIVNAIPGDAALGWHAEAPSPPRWEWFSVQELYPGVGVRLIVVPLWALILAGVVVAAVARGTSRHLPTPANGGACPRCRYDLAGLGDGRCPECGRRL